LPQLLSSILFFFHFCFFWRYSHPTYVLLLLCNIFINIFFLCLNFRFLAFLLTFFFSRFSNIF
jgi:hypothetical protein